MKREEMIARLRERSANSQAEPWDLVVIGGGATGAGVAVDAASRGFSVLLLEREDFAKGTSSRSTKLVHGGLRYLEQGNISLVMEALKERGLLLQNAPHLVHDLRFVVPNYSWWETPFLRHWPQGLRCARRQIRLRQVVASSPAKQTLEHLPTLRQDGLRGGVIYHDGQFDDARLLIDLIKTAADHGGVVVNYLPVVAFKKDADGFVAGVEALDSESGQRFHIAARVVVNATGIFTDEIRRMDDPQAQSMIAPSQGIHLVLEGSFLRGNTAVMVPHTSDGRVLFAIPWHNHTVIGTTDTPIDTPSYEPLPFEQEIDFVLETGGEYLSRQPTRDDVLSVYVGIRPLVKVAGADVRKTSSLSRDHTIHIDQSGLLTIVGGKWTTYRHMAEETMDHVIPLGKLDDRPCVTMDLRIHGYSQPADARGGLSVYGSDAEKIHALATQSPELAQQLHPRLPHIAAEVVWAAREEMARTVEDVLARRTRALFLDAHAAIAMAPITARLLAAELGRSQVWAEAQVSCFTELAAQYTLQRIAPGNPPGQQ